MPEQEAGAICYFGRRNAAEQTAGHHPALAKRNGS